MHPVTQSMVLGDMSYQEKHPRVQSEFTEAETARLREILDRFAGAQTDTDPAAP